MSMLMPVDLAPNVAPEVVPEAEADEEITLWWNANHHYTKQPVRGGWPTVRLLIGSVDGNGWPWTTVEYRTDHAYRWIQVLGTPDRMTLEVGGDGDVYRVGHAGQDRGARVPMPPECQWWVPAIWTTQTLTADEAYQIARPYLACGLLPEECSLEEILYRLHRNK